MVLPTPKYQEVIATGNHEDVEKLFDNMLDKAEKEMEYSYSSYYFYNGSYDYDYNSTIEHLPLEEFVPTVLVYSIIGLLGLVGNLLVIFSIARVKRMRSITNLFLLSLATADLLLVCFCVPVKVGFNPVMHFNYFLWVT